MFWRTCIQEILEFQYLRVSSLAFLDADDAWDKMKLDKQIKYIMNGNFDLVHCKTEYMDALGKKLE